MSDVCADSVDASPRIDLLRAALAEEVDTSLAMASYSGLFAGIQPDQATSGG
jgi:hypothetical protein